MAKIALCSISILDKIVKIVLCADDITIAVSDKKSAKIALKIIRNFKIISGLELNTEKTHGKWLGSLKNPKKQPLGIDWKKDPIKALGVHFSHNKAKSMTANFDEKIEKLKSKFNIWSSRDMTIFGRACIVNTIGLSQFKLPRVREYKEILVSCFLIERLCYLKYKKNKSFLDK